MEAGNMGGQTNQNNLVMQGVRIPTYVIIDEGTFNNEYWPKIQNAIQIMLTQRPGEPFKLSYEDLYSAAYKCATQQYSEPMFQRMSEIADNHISQSLLNFMTCTSEEYLERFNFLMAQFIQAVDGLSSIFSYMDRSYVVLKFGRSISSLLLNQFADKILSQSRIFDILKLISGGTMDAEPHIMMSLIKGLYSIKPEFARMNMQLFSRFIPNIEATAQVENLQNMVEQMREMQAEIRENLELAEGPSSKRKIDEVSEEIFANQKRAAISR
eukprot:Seg909.16 transcript_id=Seg909.16/GoldUCD/mRNA.D3Y31 product="CDK2-associated and cullin domain-containing protein 1" protein_id=Seg909.16/GoldUCD/D3Y31